MELSVLPSAHGLRCFRLRSAEVMKWWPSDDAESFVENWDWCQSIVSYCINWKKWSFCFEPWWILYCRLKLLLLVCGDLGSAVKEPSIPLVAIPLVSEARLPTRGSCYTFSYHGLGELWAVIGGLGCRPREFGKNLSSSTVKQPKQAPSEFEFDRPSLRIGELQQSFNTGRTQADADNSTVLIPSLVDCNATITVRIYIYISATVNTGRSV